MTVHENFTDIESLMLNQDGKRFVHDWQHMKKIIFATKSQLSVQKNRNAQWQKLDPFLILF